jgi:hypothetical protein
VPKVGIEPDAPGDDPPQTAAIRAIEGSAYAPDSPPKCVLGGGVDDSLDDSADDSQRRGRLLPEALLGVVETALARVLMLAAEAWRWEIVAQIAEELAASDRGRRISVQGEPNTSSLATRRRSR